MWEFQLLYRPVHAKACRMTYANTKDADQTGLDLLIPDSFQCKVPTMPDIDISTSRNLKLLTRINPSKTAGPDAIKPVVLKELAHEIAPAVSVIFQLSLDTGTVPQDWETAFVSLLYKTGDKGNTANYRPISLTCILCKTLEHIIVSCLTTSGKTQFAIWLITQIPGAPILRNSTDSTCRGPYYVSYKW